GGFFITGDGSGSGIGAFASRPDGIVRAAHNAGIVWVNSAGNEAQTHWSGHFADPDQDAVHDFVAGDEGDTFFVESGAEVCVFARWNAWSTYSDFDLYVSESATGALVTFSDGDQHSAEPTESACFTNSGPTKAFAAHLVHFDGDPGPYIDL